MPSAERFHATSSTTSTFKSSTCRTTSSQGLSRTFTTTPTLTSRARTRAPTRTRTRAFLPLTISPAAPSWMMAPPLASASGPIPAFTCRRPTRQASTASPTRNQMPRRQCPTPAASRRVRCVLRGHVSGGALCRPWGLLPQGLHSRLHLQPWLLPGQGQQHLDMRDR